MLQAPIRGAAPGSARSCAGARFRGHVASTNGPGSVRAWTASPTARHWWGGHWARRLAAAAGSRDLRYMNFVVLVPAQASAGRSFRKDLCNCTGIRNSMCVSLTRPRTSRGGACLLSSRPLCMHVQVSSAAGSPGSSGILPGAQDVRGRARRSKPRHPSPSGELCEKLAHPPAWAWMSSRVRRCVCVPRADSHSICVDAPCHLWWTMSVWGCQGSVARRFRAAR